MSLFCLLAAVAKYPGLGDRRYNSIQSTAPEFRNRSLIQAWIHLGTTTRRIRNIQIYFMHAPASYRLQNLSLVEGGGEKDW